MEMMIGKMNWSNDRWKFRYANLLTKWRLQLAS